MRRPICDCPTPEMTARCSPSAAALRRSAGGRHDAGDRMEVGQPDAVVVLELDLDVHADEHLVGLAAHDVGGEPEVLLLGQRHDGHDVGRVEVGQPRLPVHGVGEHRASARHRLDRQLAAQARRADRLRRMDPEPAGLAAQEAQLALRPAEPEVLVVGRDGRQHAEGPGGLGSVIGRSAPTTSSRGGARKRWPLMNGSGASGSSRRSGSRSNSAFSATCVSIRARCMPRHMWAPCGEPDVGLALTEDVERGGIGPAGLVTVGRAEVARRRSSPWGAACRPARCPG